MRTPSDDFQELRDILGDLREGAVRPEQAARLDELLAEGPEALDYYLRYMELCATLHHYQGQLAAADMERPEGLLSSREAAPPVDRRRRGGPRSWPSFRRAVSWTGAVVGLAASLLILFASSSGRWRSTARDAKFPSRTVSRPALGPKSYRPEPLALVLKLESVHWSSSSGPGPREGAVLAPGPFRLDAGRATLAFLNGTLLAIEGPAEIDLIDIDQIECRHGKLSVRAPAGAEGFKVTAPGSAFVDQGTEFALNIAEDGRAKLKVVEGAAEAALIGASGNPDRIRKVVENEICELDPNLQHIDTTREGPERFTSIPKLDPSPLDLAPGYPEAVRAAGPWGYWRFETRQGDAVPNELTGRPPLRAKGAVHLVDAGDGNRAAEFPADREGPCLTIDGPWSPASVPGHAVELWFLPRAIAYSSLVSIYPPTQPGHFRHLLLVELTAGDHRSLLHKPASTRFLHRWPPDEIGGRNLYSPNLYVPYRWHHLVAQMAENRLELYLNGEPSGSVPLETVNGTLPCRVVLGRLGLPSSLANAEIRPFFGLIDELAIYNRALASEEIRRHHALGRAGTSITSPLGSSSTKTFQVDQKSTGRTAPSRSARSIVPVPVGFLPRGKRSKPCCRVVVELSP